MKNSKGILSQLPTVVVSDLDEILLYLHTFVDEVLLISSAFKYPKPNVRLRQQQYNGKVICGVQEGSLSCFKLAIIDLFSPVTLMGIMSLIETVQMSCCTTSDGNRRNLQCCASNVRFLSVWYSLSNANVAVGITIEHMLLMCRQRERQTNRITSNFRAPLKRTTKSLHRLLKRRRSCSVNGQNKS